MKTLLKTSAIRKKSTLLLLAGAALLAPLCPLRAADGPQPAGVRHLANLCYQVWASNPAGLAGSLRLVQADGRVLYEEGSRSVSFGRCLNLGELPDGRYAFVVRLGTRQYRFPVQLRTTSLRTAELEGDTARVRLAAAL